MGACQRQAELRDWVLHELDPEGARQIEEHVRQCPECAQSARLLLEVRTALTSSLADQEMPAHLVVAAAPPKRAFNGFWASLARAMALSAASACVFLAVLSAGFARWKNRLLPATPQPQQVLTEAEIRTLVSQAVADEVAAHLKKTSDSNQQLAATLRREREQDFAQLAQRLQFLELAQNTVWKETQQQGAIVGAIARNSLQPRTQK